VTWNLHLVLRLELGYHKTPYHKLDHNVKSVRMKIYPRLERDRLQCDRKLSIDLRKPLPQNWVAPPEVEDIRFPWRRWWLDTTLNGVTTQKETTFPAAALGNSNIVNCFLYCCWLGTKEILLY